MVHTGRVSLIYIQKERYFYFIALVLKVLKSSFFKKIKKYSTRYFIVLKNLIKNNKITLITPKFSMQEYEKIKSKNSLNETTIDLLHLINKYRKKHDLKDQLIIHLVDNQLQMFKKDTRGMYQTYFYVNLFNLLENSNIISKKILSKRAIEKLLNDIIDI